VLVSSGLQVGDQVIVAGLQKVRAGAVVNPVVKQQLAANQSASSQNAAKTE